MFGFKDALRHKCDLHRLHGVKTIRVLQDDKPDTNFRFKCGCDMRQRSVGDGCQICNTEYAINLIPQPSELADSLSHNGGFSDDQSETIVSEVYQPLMSLISTLNDKIDQLSRAR